MAFTVEHELVAKRILDFPHPDLTDCFEIAERRKHFFVTGLESLHRRKQGLDSSFRTFFSGNALCPPKDTLKNVLQGEPITLIAACKLALALEYLAKDKSLASEPLRASLTPQGSSGVIQISDHSVVPSIYFANRDYIRKARELLKSGNGGYTRPQASKLVYGNQYDTQKHQHLFKYLEDGDESIAKNGGAFDYKITRFLAERIFEVLKDSLPLVLGIESVDLSWESLYRTDYKAGSKAGDTTISLSISMGNLTAPIQTPSQRVAAA